MPIIINYQYYNKKNNNIIKNIVKAEKKKFYDGKRECRHYNIQVKYTRKAFSQSFLNYLESVYFNSMTYLY